MSAKDNPQSNFLAATGMAADPQGRLVQPSRGPLNLSWLVRISPETARKARERLAHGNMKLDADTLAGWFCLGSPADQMALDQLEQRAWRKALKIWKGQEGERISQHNRATLHRLMYLAEDQESPGGHLRKAFELYHRLVRETGVASYQPLAQWASSELRECLVDHHKRGDEDEMVAKSLLMVSTVQGMAACEELQEELMLDELDDLALLVATLQRELLPYQGVVHAAPRQLLASARERTELDVLPPAQRLSFRLAPGTRQRRRVDAMVAELCALLAQSLFKAGDGQQGKKYQGEARRWEPKIAEQWKEPEPEHLGDESAARVEFPREDCEADSEGPRARGFWLLGVSGKPVLVRQHEAREEWLEAVRVMGVALFPLRLYAVYRNLDTGELGYSQRLPLRGGHYLWQIAAVVLASFLLVAGLFQLSPGVLGRSTRAPVRAVDPAARQAGIESALERLKRLAQAEAELLKAPRPDPKRLESIRRERQDLITRVQRLERGEKP